MWEDENVVSLVVQLVCCWTGGERNNQPSMGAAMVDGNGATGDGTTGYDDDEDDDG